MWLTKGFELTLRRPSCPEMCRLAGRLMADVRVRRRSPGPRKSTRLSRNDGDGTNFVDQLTPFSSISSHHDSPDLGVMPENPKLGDRGRPERRLQGSTPHSLGPKGSMRRTRVTAASSRHDRAQFRSVSFAPCGHRAAARFARPHRQGRTGLPINPEAPIRSINRHCHRRPGRLRQPRRHRHRHRQRVGFGDRAGTGNASVSATGRHWQREPRADHHHHQRPDRRAVPG